MPGSHHINGPSSLKRRRACPGSMKMELGLPEEPSADADEGTMLHACVADILSGGSLKDIEITPDQQELVDACVQLVKQYEGKIHIEEKLRLLNDDFSVLSDGTADVVIVNKVGVILIDWKFGRKKVENAAENIQMAAYSAMAMQKFGKDSCVAIVFQPRVSNEPSTYEYTDERKITAYINDVISRCEAEDAPLVQGEEQCRYCKAKHTCPEVSKALSKVDLPLTAEGKLALVDPVKLADMYEKWLDVKKIGEKIERKVKYDLMAGNNVPGYAVKRRPGNREIEHPVIAWAALEGVLSQDEYLSATTVSPAQLEKTFINKKYKEAKEAGEKITKKTLENEFGQRMEGIITRKADVVTVYKVKEGK